MRRFVDRWWSCSSRALLGLCSPVDDGQWEFVRNREIFTMRVVNIVHTGVQEEGTSGSGLVCLDTTFTLAAVNGCLISMYYSKELEHTIRKACCKGKQ